MQNWRISIQSAIDTKRALPPPQSHGGGGVALAGEMERLFLCGEEAVGGNQYVLCILPLL